MPGHSYNGGVTATKEKFTGKERDVETGLDYFGARYYASGIGRWLSVDPLAEKYPSWSPYNYVLNNPVGMVDPDGRLVTPPGDYYGYDGKYLRSDNQLDGKVYIYKNANQKEYVTTDVATLKALSIVTHSETTRFANWEQRTGVAETVRNRAEISGRTIFATATNLSEYKGPANTRGVAITSNLANYSGGSDISSGDQKSAAKSAIAALRGSNAAQGADGFDGFKDLVGDFKAVENRIDPKDGGVLRAGRGYDRPLKGMDTSLINGASINLPSTTNLLPGPIQTYQATKVVWDTGKTGTSGTVFYKTHPASGLRY